MRWWSCRSLWRLCKDRDQGTGGGKNAEAEASAFFLCRRESADVGETVWEERVWGAVGGGQARRSVGIVKAMGRSRDERNVTWV